VLFLDQGNQRLTEFRVNQEGEFELARDQRVPLVNPTYMCTAGDRIFVLKDVCISNAIHWWVPMHVEATDHGTTEGNGEGVGTAPAAGDAVAG